jgi:hypothetical protein
LKRSSGRRKAPGEGRRWQINPPYGNTTPARAFTIDTTCDVIAPLEFKSNRNVITPPPLRNGFFQREKCSDWKSLNFSKLNFN